MNEQMRKLWMECHGVDYCAQPTTGRLTVAEARRKYGRRVLKAALEAGHIYITRHFLDPMRPSPDHWWESKIELVEANDDDLLVANQRPIG